ncbi:MAG: lipase [Bacteroidetes bacterium 43-16]|nr:MAG: lipase [Bacteroidetes bacterium 43-16]
MRYIILFSIFLFHSVAIARTLQPGFSKAEYLETIKANARVHYDLDKWDSIKKVPASDQYDFIYRSPVVGFENMWDLWVAKDKSIAIISIRGSVMTQASFLANLYAAMVPAKGTLELDKNTSFKYELADHPAAAVHVGWLIAMAYLAPDIEHKIDSCYKKGIKQFILTGHSQGGGITFLLNAHLKHKQAKGGIPKDILFKTYCSAGPKPGNLVFAYDYERMNYGGWAYNVVNAADWVPDVPFSIQTVNDFTNVNPFRNAKKAIKKMKFPNNLIVKHMYNKLDRPTKRAQKNFEKYLGRMTSKIVKKTLPDFKSPDYYKSNYYVRTGNIIALIPDEAYNKTFNNTPENPDVWEHHLFEPYLFLTNKLPE